VIEWATFGFKLWSHGPLAPNMNYQITATVTLTDENPSVAPAAAPYFTSPETPTISVVEFLDCVTKMLFPYVNTYNGTGTAFSHFGTGIDFANTTWDPFANTDSSGNLIYPDEAKGSAVPQNGSCTVYFYNHDSTPPIVWTTPQIMAGGSYAFDVGSTVPAFYNKWGYAIALCNFQNAYGFAEIWDNYGLGDPGTILGFEAYILPNPAFYHRSPAGDGLGESAIAPININRSLLKLLMLDPRH